MFIYIKRNPKHDVMDVFHLSQHRSQSWKCKKSFLLGWYFPFSESLRMVLVPNHFVNRLWIYIQGHNLC